MTKVIKSANPHMEGENVYTIARPSAPDGTTILSTHMSGSTFEVHVYDMSDQGGSAIFSDTSRTVATYMHSSLQTDFGLPGGHSFEHILTYAEAGLDAGKSYKIEYKLPTTSYGNIIFIHELSVKAAIHIA